MDWGIEYADALSAKLPELVGLDPYELAFYNLIQKQRGLPGWPPPKKLGRPPKQKTAQALPKSAKVTKPNPRSKKQPRIGSKRSLPKKQLTRSRRFAKGTRAWRELHTRPIVVCAAWIDDDVLEDINLRLAQRLFQAIGQNR